MDNNITERGLELIIGHLQNRIKGISFTEEVSRSYFSVPPTYSMYDIQTLAEKIAAHMALVGYTPVIQLDNLPNNVAGQINLNDSRYVYIKLDKRRFECRDYAPVELVAVIAHEMSHKFLWIHGFKDTSRKIEYMTDACAVYAGFGDFLQEAAERTSRQYINGVEHVVVHRLGYLERWQILYLRNTFFNLCTPYDRFKRPKDANGKPVVTTEEETSYWERFAIMAAVVIVVVLSIAYILGR